MLRLLALPIAMAAALAPAGCAAGERGGTSTAPGIAPDASMSSGRATPPSASSGPGDEGAAGTTDPASSAPPGLLSSPSPAGAGDPGTPGLPDGSGASVDDVLRLGAVATWVDRPALIALSLPASSSCWAFAGEPVAESTTRILVEVDEPSACESPDDARTYAIEVPAGIDASAELQLAVVGLEHDFTLTLPGR